MKHKLIILVTLMLPSLAFAGGNEYCGRCTPPSGETSANSTAKATATAVNETNVRVINANMLQSTSNINVNGGNPTATAYGGTGGSSNVTLQKGAVEGGDANAKVTLEKGAIKAEGGKSTVMQQQTAEGGDASNKGNTQEVNIAAPKRAPTFVAPTEAIVHQAPYVAKDGRPITSFVAEENVLMQSCPVGEIDGDNSSQSRSGWAEDRLVRVTFNSGLQYKTLGKKGVEPIKVNTYTFTENTAKGQFRFVCLGIVMASANPKKVGEVDLSRLRILTNKYLKADLHGHTNLRLIAVPKHSYTANIGNISAGNALAAQAGGSGFWGGLLGLFGISVTDSDTQTFLEAKVGELYLLVTDITDQTPTNAHIVDLYDLLHPQI